MYQSLSVPKYMAIQPYWNQDSRFNEIWDAFKFWNQDTKSNTSELSEAFEYRVHIWNCSRKE